MNIKQINIEQVIYPKNNWLCQTCWDDKFTFISENNPLESLKFSLRNKRFIVFILIKLYKIIFLSIILSAFLKGKITLAQKRSVEYFYFLFQVVPGTIRELVINFSFEKSTIV